MKMSSSTLQDDQKVYNVDGSELVIKVPGSGSKMKGRGTRMSKGLTRPRPLQQLVQFDRSKLKLDMVEDGTRCADAAVTSPEIRPEDISIDINQTMDENNNLGGPVDLEDINLEIEKQSQVLKGLEMGKNNNSIGVGENSSYFKETNVDNSTTSCRSDISSNWSTEKDVKHEKLELPACSSYAKEVYSDTTPSKSRRVFPVRQLSLINDTMKEVKGPMSASSVLNSSIKGRDTFEEKESSVNKTILGELEHMEQIAYNLPSYQFLHPEVICMCDSLKKNGHKFRSYYPARTSKILSTLKRAATRQIRGIHPAIPKHLIASGVVIVEKEQTIAELSAVSSKAISKAFEEVLANEEVEQDGEPTTAQLAAVSSKALHNALTSAVESCSSYTNHGLPTRNTMSGLPLVEGSNHKFPSRTSDSKEFVSDQGAERSSKNVSLESKPDRESDHTIGVAASRTSGDRRGMPYNPPTTFDFEQKLKSISNWPLPMLEGFLKDSADPVTAVDRLVACLEAEARYINRTLKSETRRETHACTCSINGRIFPVGYSFSAEAAKVEAALSVLTNVIGLPRDKFIKEDTDEVKHVEQSPIVAAKPADTGSREEWNPRLPPRPNRIAPQTVSARPPDSNSIKQNTSSISNNPASKLRLAMLYPNPTLQPYLSDLSDPLASVTCLAQCLDLKPKFMNDVITSDSQSQEESHSSIVCIGNLAFTPGYGVDLKAAKQNAALNAIMEIKDMAKKTT